MSTDVVMQLVCPHCDYYLFETVSLIRPNASAYCPACCKSFVLDPEIEAMSRLLGEAQAARRERKRRRQELLASWHAPPVQQSPQIPSDVLARLDQLLAELRAPSKTRKRA
jgi:hypothetical protein